MIEVRSDEWMFSGPEVSLRAEHVLHSLPEEIDSLANEPGGDSNEAGEYVFLSDFAA